MPSNLPVLYPDRTHAFRAKDWEIARLDAYECIRVERNARDEPRSAVLIVPMHVVKAVLARPKTVRSSAGITINKQAAGAGKWVQRPDMAGRGAGSLPAATIHFGMGIREVNA